MRKDELHAIVDALDLLLEMVARINFHIDHFDCVRSNDAKANIARLREFANETPAISSSVPPEPTATAPKVDDEDDYIGRIARSIEARWRERGLIK